MIIAVGVVALLVILNSLGLRAPGDGPGKGFAFQTGDLNFGFSGLNSPGDWLASLFSWAIVLAVVGGSWFRVWVPVRSSKAAWRRVAYFASLAVFVAALPAFLLVELTLSPDDPDRSVAFTKTNLTITLGLVATAFCLAVGLPYMGAKAAANASPLAAPSHGLVHGRAP